jgi:hypothetical protein
LGKSFLNTFLTPTAHLLISRLVGVASWCGHERARFDSTGGWLWPAAPPARNLKTKPMTDFIHLAVIALFFVASGLYARWCEKL